MHCRIPTIKKSVTGSLRAFAINMLMVYVVYAVCRVAFVLENWTLYKDTLFENSWSDLVGGSLLFDTSAILYTNLLYILLMLLPCHWKEKDAWQRLARWVFVVVNALCGVVMNLGDAVYVQYTGRRTTATVFREFGGEGNLGSIFGTELLRHWYLLLLGLALIAALWWGYRQPKGTFSLREKTHIVRYYVLHTVCFVLFAGLTIAGMRGGFTTAVRPITISNANQYVNHPIEAAAVLNTPFSLIRTMGNKSFTTPEFFASEEALDKVYSPLHQPAERHDSIPVVFARKNVVVLIVESFGREFIGAYNKADSTGLAPSLDSDYKGFTPFVDSLYQHSLSFDYTFANGRKSIDGMPSILSGIPMFVEPFFLTPASMNDVSGLAGELSQEGYETAFFHGAENGSMGFQAFARATGFQHYFGRTEFNEDKRFRGDKDFDGTWAIWDEPFLQFYALQMSQMKEPFMTAVFTASSHHPFHVPEEYKDRFPEEGGNELHKCIRYTDYSLRRFFETARQQPWFRNTIFVLTSDHTNQPDHDEYKTDLGVFGSPLLFYDPSGELIPAGRRHCIAQQIDIMPSLLGVLGYEHPFVAFGQDLFHTPDADTWAVNYNNGIYQLVKGEWMLQFDGNSVVGLYNIRQDWMLKHNEANQHPDIQHPMEHLMKGIMQSYMTRMNQNQLTIKK